MRNNHVSLQFAEPVLAIPNAAAKVILPLAFVRIFTPSET
jgi:hypothetical protein